MAQPTKARWGAAYKYSRFVGYPPAWCFRGLPAKKAPKFDSLKAPWATPPTVYIFTKHLWKGKKCRRCGREKEAP